MPDHPYDEAYNLTLCQIPQTQNHASGPFPGFRGVFTGLALLGFGGAGLVGFGGLAGFGGALAVLGLVGFGRAGLVGFGRAGLVGFGALVGTN